MKKFEMKCGGIYMAKVNGKLEKVRLEGMGLGGLGRRQRTTYQVTNLTTLRKMMISSAAKFHSEVDAVV